MSASIDRIFALVFAALITAPLAQMLTHLVREPVVEELRQPHTLSTPLVRLVAMDPRLSDDVNAWFNDRFGFRSVLIRLKNELDYQLFRTSDRVIVGRDGYLFDKGFIGQIVDDAANPVLDDEILTTIRNLRACLARRDIKLIVVFNPTKSSIYPQFLPAKLPLDPPPRLARRLAAVLDREPGLVFVDGERILAMHADEELFYQTDVHMNLKASAYVFRNMLVQIAQATGRPVPHPAPETWSTVNWNGGAEARFLAKLLPVRNTSYVTPGSASAFRDDDLSTFERNVGSAALPEHPEWPLFEVIFRNKRDSSGLLPPTMLFGTSFSDAIFALKYNEAFATIYRTISNAPERLGPLFERLPNDAKVFIMEFPEMFLHLLAKADPSPNCQSNRGP